MVTGRNSLEPLGYVTAKILYFYQKLILVLAITELFKNSSLEKVGVKTGNRT